MEEEPEKLTYKAQPKEVKKKPGKCGVKKKKREREEKRTFQEEDIIGVKWCYKVK